MRKRTNKQIVKADRDKLYRMMQRNTIAHRLAQNNHTSLSTMLGWNYVKVQRVVISLLKTGDVEVVNGIVYLTT